MAENNELRKTEKALEKENEQLKKQLAELEAAKAAENKEEPQVEVISEEEKAKQKLLNDYNKFAELKFLMYKDGQYIRKALKPAALAQFDELEKEMKKVKGRKPKRSCTVFLKDHNSTTRIVEGYSVPDELYKKFESEGIVNKYF